MKKIYKNTLALALSINLATTLSLQAEVIQLEEDIQSSICPSTEISYLNNLSTHTLMEGKAEIDYSWDSDKYSFTPNANGSVKVTYNSEERLSVKIDYVCNGSGIYRLADDFSAISGSTEFRVLADQEVHIGLWDWDNGPYLYDLNIEFTPDDDTGGDDDNDTTPSTQTIYEDAQNGNTDGWENLRIHPGLITNILTEGNRVINLTGPNADSYRASYILKMDDGSNWANSEQFVVKWDIKTSDRYELFFYAKSDDDASILNYIGYVSEFPELEGYSFDAATGYWSIGEEILHDWGRYVYNVISEDTSIQLTSFTKDLKSEALNTLGINLTSVEYLHVNVIGTESSNIILDNILLQTDINSTKPINTPPVAIEQNITVDKNSSVDFTLTATDADNDTLSFTISSDVSNGTLSGSAPNLTYTPDIGFIGVDSFTFSASDANASSTKSINITVNDVENIVEIQENEALSEHFLGMSIGLDASKIIIKGDIVPNWDMDRYSFNSNSLDEIKITLKNEDGEDMPFYVIKNYLELISQNSGGFYSLGGEFSLITVMIIAENTTDTNKEYTLTIEQ